MADEAFTPVSIIDVEEDTRSSSTNKTSRAYLYFTHKNLRYYCNYCSKNFGEKATTTLWRHIYAKHPNAIQEEKEKIVREMDKFVKSECKENVSNFYFNIYIIYR